MILRAMLLCGRIGWQQWWTEDEGFLTEVGEKLFPTGEHLFPNQHSGIQPEGPDRTTNVKVSPNMCLKQGNT